MKEEARQWIEKSQLVRELNTFKKKITKKYHPEKVIFFGSRASGKPRKDSDVDLIIVSKKFNKISSLKRSPDLYLAWDLDYPVDFLCYTPKEFNRLKKQISIVREALKTGIVIK